VPARQGVVDRIELELPGRGDYELVAYVVHPESPVAKGQRLPRWARPSLLVRDGRSLRPHLAGRAQAGDQIYIITTPEYVGLLDRMLARPAASTVEPELFGEFTIAPDTRMRELAATYGVTYRDGEGDITVAELLRRDLAGDLERGDRVAYGPVDLIVRQVSDEHEIEEVGLALEHRPTARARLPAFHTWKDLRAHLRRWWKGGQAPAVETLPAAQQSAAAYERPAAPPEEPPAENPDEPPATAA
jgi:cell volume regulation protein A